ncbi:Snaclec agkicetin-C subunit beta [Varanus komodoensis]|nr:Snaclec agkicetin-C subunit beta [Varanus komodoensis]
MASLLLLLLALCLLMPPVDAWVDEARFKLSCPQAACWHYWNGNCYCLETNQKRSWSEALKFCKAYKFTELITFVSTEEKNWIISFPLDNFWTGLNNLEESGSFSGSEGTRANMKLPW